MMRKVHVELFSQNSQVTMRQRQTNEQTHRHSPCITARINSRY